jgi:hypothetical protein
MGLGRSWACAAAAARGRGAHGAHRAGLGGRCLQGAGLCISVAELEQPLCMLGGAGRLPEEARIVTPGAQSSFVGDAGCADKLQFRLLHC